MSKKRRNVTNVTNPQPVQALFRRSTHFYFSKLRFAVVWLEQIQNLELEPGHDVLVWNSARNDSDYTHARAKTPLGKAHRWLADPGLNFPFRALDFQKLEIRDHNARGLFSDGS